MSEYTDDDEEIRLDENDGNKQSKDEHLPQKFLLQESTVLTISPKTVSFLVQVIQTSETGTCFLLRKA